MAQANIRDAALQHGYIDARPVTGHAFDVWRERLKVTGQRFPFAHDPARACKWLRKQTTLWVAIAPTPPMAGWPEGCGEIGAFYLCSWQRRERQAAWEDAVAALGYNIKRGVMLPERAAAIRAGLGVHGLNGMMLAPNFGSFIDITILPVHAAPPPEARGPEHDLSPGCEKCGECIKACPTGAISENGVNAILCLRSYMNRLEALPEASYPKMGRRILGCDTCQHACPSNATLVRQQPLAEITECMKLENLLTSPEASFISFWKNKYFNDTSIKTQAVLAAANTGRKDLLPLVEELIGSDDKMLCKKAQWAAESLKS